jgi:predicted dienelactone hydrolase
MRGPFVFRGAENAMPRLGSHPLVIISHRSGSGQLTHMNLAIHLTDAGYIVAAPTHAHENFQDESGSGTADVIKGRAETISEVIDRISTPNPLSLVVDGEQIAVVGFSAGGATVLALSGLSN